MKQVYFEEKSLKLNNETPTNKRLITRTGDIKLHTQPLALG